MGRSVIADIRQKLRKSRREMLQCIATLDDQAADYRWRPDAWSVKDHVAHLAAVEESVLHFAHRILDEDCPISPLCYNKAFDQDAWNNKIVAEWAVYTWAEVRRNLNEIHQALFSLLDQTPEEKLNRLGSHPVWGEPVTLASVLRVPYRHERAHRDEIAALCQLLQDNPVNPCLTNYQ